MSRIALEREVALKEFLQVVASRPRPSAEERNALAVACNGGDGVAARALLESYLPMVVAEAAARRGLGLRFEALLAAGNRALAAALPRAVSNVRSMDAVLRHAVVQELKDAWMDGAEKRRDRRHF